ncbi:hypothetical protein DENSPDRAFT_717659 [Dentipellis sp. KUC8613]|nr:hypothetical protein DENSPDRAFT_717659 [Dentipellis sp. KUC8613]
MAMRGRGTAAEGQHTDMQARLQRGVVQRKHAARGSREEAQRNMAPHGARGTRMCVAGVRRHVMASRGHGPQDGSTGSCGRGARVVVAGTARAAGATSSSVKRLHACVNRQQAHDSPRGARPPYGTRKVQGMTRRRRDGARGGPMGREKGTAWLGLENAGEGNPGRESRGAGLERRGSTREGEEGRPGACQGGRGREGGCAAREHRRIAWECVHGLRVRATAIQGARGRAHS